MVGKRAKPWCLMLSSWGLCPLRFPPPIAISLGLPWGQHPQDPGQAACLRATANIAFLKRFIPKDNISKQQVFLPLRESLFFGGGSGEGWSSPQAFDKAGELTGYGAGAMSWLQRDRELIFVWLGSEREAFGLVRVGVQDRVRVMVAEPHLLTVEPYLICCMGLNGQESSNPRKLFNMW